MRHVRIAQVGVVAVFAASIATTTLWSDLSVSANAAIPSRTHLIHLPAPRPVVAQALADSFLGRKLASAAVAASQELTSITDEIMAQWSRVAACEEAGNWHVIGPRFSGGLGITNDNWLNYGGGRFAPNAGLATPRQQVAVAIRIQRFPPDQHGCSGSW